MPVAPDCSTECLLVAALVQIQSPLVLVAVAVSSEAALSKSQRYTGEPARSSGMPSSRTNTKAAAWMDTLV